MSNPINNIINFPNVSITEQTSKKVTGHLTKTVYPIKDISQIHDLHRYLLSAAKNASSPAKAKNAYRNWLFFALGINLGFRGGDISELTWDKLVNYDSDTDTYTIRNDEYNFIHAEKTGKATFIILNKEAEKYIKLYLTAVRPYGIRPLPFTPVFPSSKKAGTSAAEVAGHIDCDNIGRILKKAAKEVGITTPVCTHSLRKTFGYHYYKETGDIITLQKIFGHSSPAITLAYIGIDIEELITAYSSKPDTSIDDLEDYLPDDVPPVENISHTEHEYISIPPVRRPALYKMETIASTKLKPTIMYSTDRYPIRAAAYD